jgi:hypothetical protein
MSGGAEPRDPREPAAAGSKRWLGHFLHADPIRQMSADFGAILVGARIGERAAGRVESAFIPALPAACGHGGSSGGPVAAWSREPYPAATINQKATGRGCNV